MPIFEPEFMALTETLDVAAFWQENDVCRAFTTSKPRCPVSFSPDDHWIFEFMGVPSTIRYYQDKVYRDGLHCEVNRITREYTGRAFFAEDTWQHQPRRIENLFGCEFDYHEGGTPWFIPVTGDPDEFARILDTVETIDLQRWCFSKDYLAEWEDRKQAGKRMPFLGTGSRGPATIMSSVIAPENLFLWMYDHPDLMRRFRDLLAEKMVAVNTVLREFSGNTRSGWWITDDNCALFNGALYREYCYPVLEKMLNAMAPGNLSLRHQHSDSAMEHLIDMQKTLGIRSVNYGPTVDVALIREKMPDALIEGQMPPMLLRNGRPGKIRDRILEDFKKAGQSGGLVMATAGSLAAGTGVGRMRWFMQVVQDSCRYDGPAEPGPAC